VSLAKDAAFHGELEFCWDEEGDHLPRSPSGTADLFCVTEKGTSSLSEQFFPTSLCPQSPFTKPN